MPRRSRSSRSCVPHRRPRTTTSPSSGVLRPSQISMVVVFPAPFGPSSPKHSPALTSRWRPSTAVTSEYRLRRSLTRRAGAAGIEGEYAWIRGDGRFPDKDSLAPDDLSVRHGHKFGVRRHAYVHPTSADVSISPGRPCILDVQPENGPNMTRDSEGTAGAIAIHHLVAGVRDGIITNEQLNSLLARAAAERTDEPEVRRGFNAVTIAYWAGAIAVLFALGWFLLERWIQLGAGGVLA